MMSTRKSGVWPPPTSVHMRLTPPHSHESTWAGPPLCERHKWMGPKLVPRQPWARRVRSFIFSAPAYEGGWPILSSPVTSSHRQCTVGVLIAESVRGADIFTLISAPTGDFNSWLAVQYANRYHHTPLIRQSHCECIFCLTAIVLACHFIRHHLMA